MLSGFAAISAFYLKPVATELGKYKLDSVECMRADGAIVILNQLTIIGFSMEMGILNLI
jgi:hypothetical protein